jgi:hypothetical protein
MTTKLRRQEKPVRGAHGRKILATGSEFIRGRQFASLPSSSHHKAARHRTTQPVYIFSFIGLIGLPTRHCLHDRSLTGRRIGSLQILVLQRDTLIAHQKEAEPHQRTTLRQQANQTAQQATPIHSLRQLFPDSRFFFSQTFAETPIVNFAANSFPRPVVVFRRLPQLDAHGSCPRAYICSLTLVNLQHGWEANGGSLQGSIQEP